MPENWELILRLLLAAGLGGLIWTALRPSMLAGLRAGLSTTILAFGFAVVAGSWHGVLDPSRFWVQAIASMGLFAAGAVLNGGDMVKGPITAVGFWLLAAVGFAMGAGLMPEAIAATAMLVVILAGTRFAEEWLQEKNSTRDLVVKVTAGALSPVEMHLALGYRSQHITHCVATRADENTENVRITFQRVTPAMVAGIIADLRKMPGTLNVTQP